MNLHTESNPKLIYPENNISDHREIIRLEKVSVQYRMPEERIGSFKEYAIRFIQGKLHYHKFWALKDIDLTIYRGEVFGLIGKNGAGKSTLLKVISRVLRPTKGKTVLYGKVAPLLELGAGFHPELTGRENVFLNGSLLGYSRKEMQSCFDQVVDFAELHQFIDAPIRTYSSGMYARLGFAVATAHIPEILLVDEILSVGDEVFQKKCFARINEFREKGSTIILVSHNMNQIEQMCQRVAWVNSGIIEQLGEPIPVIKAFREGIR
ncbi:MAG: ABC transporter ATP-binding protein [Porphyromonadaceae bacterium]|nr:ABC transporter ATP-binding protein [Porphyromonadaceae bacterium]